MARKITPRFRKSLLALAAGAVLAPNGTWALDLAEAPPGTVEPYIRPNVILSLDDSTSMNGGMYSRAGVYLGTRNVVLKQALYDTFSDTSLLPEGKIRLAWQSLNNCTSLDGQKAGAKLTAADAASTGKMNLMRIYNNAHRNTFLRYVTAFGNQGQWGSAACSSGTPTHDLFQAADLYMRAPTHQNGPWSGNPGGSDTESTKYLGCRRNFHIVLTDGGWNGGERRTTPRNYDGTTASWPSNLPTATAAQTGYIRDTEN